MPTARSYHDVTSAYADGVRAFFAPGPLPAGERGMGPVTVSELTSRGKALERCSAELAVAASTQLASADVELRLEASIGLLAKALTDLEVSRALLAAAEEAEGESRGSRRGERAERGVAIARPAELDRSLRLILGEEPEAEEQAERGIDLPTTIEQARRQLAGLAETSLLLIRDRASSTAWEALKGVARIGAGQLASAAGLVGMQVAEALGQAEKLTKLYKLARGFLGKALESLKALLGPALAQTVGEQVVTWLKGVATEKKFSSLVEKLYQAEPSAQTLAKLAKDSPADLPRFVAAIQGVDALEAAHRKQIELAGKITKAIKYVAFVPAAAVPAARLVSAAAYILVGGYVVLAGGDYVDWQHLQRLDRVPGVRRILETNLALP